MSGTQAAFACESKLKRPERHINHLVIGETVVLMALGGVGVLAFAWSTVVLLGGFVTALGKMDFWFITALSLLQTARIFNILADEQYRYFLDIFLVPINKYIKRFITTTGQQGQEGSDAVATTGQQGQENSTCCRASNFICPLLAIPLMIFIIHPVLVFLVSITLSSIRLHQNYYGQGEGRENLKPAIIIFYSLAIAQGVLYLVWLVLIILENPMVKFVYRECKFESRWGHEYVKRYLTETRSKCLKDLSATKESNLITHASDLIDSDYNEDYISGARILVTFIEKEELPVKALIRFSRTKIQKLILILAWTDPEDMEIRLLAAKIVAHIASDISLPLFPGTLNSLSSLLKVPVEHPIFNYKERSDRDNIMDKDKSKLVIQGFNILEKLCSDEHNCIEICNAEVLIRHILAWVFCRPVLRAVQGQDDIWVIIVTKSFNVMARLTNIRGEAAEEVRSKILFDLYPRCILGYENHKQIQAKAIYTFSQACAKSKLLENEAPKRDKLVQILLELFFGKLKPVPSTETQEGISASGSTRIDKSSIEIEENEAGSEAALVQAEAGEALSRLSVYSTNCAAIIRFRSDIISEIYKMIDSRLSSDSKYHSRAVAADILMRIFRYYFYKKQEKVPQKEDGLCDPEKFYILSTKVGEKLQEWLGKMTDQQFRYGQVSGFAQADNLSDEKYDLKKLQATLVRLVNLIVEEGRLVCDWMVDTEKISSFLQLLKKLVDGNKNDATPNTLELIKWVAALVKVMINRRIIVADGNGSVEQKIEGLINSLSEASDALSNVDSWMLYLRTHSRGVVAATTLSALVDDIRKLVAEASEKEKGKDKLEADKTGGTSGSKEDPQARPSQFAR